MITTYQLNLKPVNEIIESHGIGPGGIIQKMVTNEIIKMSDPYVPLSLGSGVHMKDTILIASDFTYYEHISPYARNQWYGKLMVDPITKKGAFYKEGYGFWSRPGVQKELTDRNLQHDGVRQAKWAEAAWKQHGPQVISNIERLINSDNY